MFGNICCKPESCCAFYYQRIKSFLHQIRLSQVSVVAESSEWFFFLQKICTCCAFCLGLRQTCFEASDLRGAQHRCSTRFVAISCFYCLFTIGFGMKNLIYVRKRTVAVDLRCSKTSFKLAIDRSFAFMLNK